MPAGVRERVQVSKSHRSEPESTGRKRLQTHGYSITHDKTVADHTDSHVLCDAVGNAFPKESFGERLPSQGCFFLCVYDAGVGGIRRLAHALQ